MINRRRFLQGVEVVSVVSLGGCAGDNDGDSADGGTPEPFSVGESVTYGGLEMAVSETQIAERITTADGSDAGNERDEITPEQGAIFALGYIRIENVGDTEIFYPERGGDVRMVYKGEEANDEFVSGPIGINEEMGPEYSDSMREKGADTGAYPDTVVEGWAVFEVPEGFERSDAFVTIRYSDTSADSRTFRWQLV